MRTKTNMISIGLLSLGLIACGVDKGNYLQEIDVPKFNAKYCSDKASADFKLGERYYEQKQFDLAFETFSKASTQDCANADFFIGTMYQNGQITGNTKEENSVKSTLSYRKACEKGLTTACTKNKN